MAKKSLRHKHNISFLTSITCAVLAAPGFAADVSAPDLFAAGSASGPATAGQATPSTQRHLQANLSLIDQLPSDGTGRLRLNLFDDLVFTARFEHLDGASTPATAWWGSLEEDPLGSFTLVRSDSGILAVVRTSGQGSFEIRSDKGGSSVIRSIDASALHCAVEKSNAPSTAISRAAIDSPTIGKNQSQAGFTLTSIPTLLSAPPLTYNCDDGTVIDIMVVYTTQARMAAGGTAAMNSNIAQAITSANAAFNNSLISTSLHLVFSYEVNYVDGSSPTDPFGVDLARLVNPSDGYLDDVPPLRDQYGADCLSFWGNNYNLAGVGFYPDSSLQGIGASGITLMDWRGYNGLLLAHEIGHNLWCAHDPAHTNPSDTPPQAYSHGYTEPGNAWQDIMAQTPGVPQIPYYANPNVSWPGPTPPHPGPTGLAGTSDLYTTIMATRKIIANFRPTAITGLGPVLYVKSSAAPGGAGQSWATAVNDLQIALCKAAASGGTVHQIWVAAGTYKPDRATGDRSGAFNLQNNLALYGGFAGTETLLSQRNVTANVTILSGEIGAAGTADNCYHVVKSTNNDATARLDGFQITAGNANSANYPDYYGGGLYTSSSTATIANCTFTANHASNWGGGVFNQSSTPLLADCTFTSNTADGNGGALANGQSTPRLRNCLFTLNSAYRAGAVYNDGASPAFYANCRFFNNTATGESGGAVGSSNTSPTFVNCLFSGNHSNWYGGAFYDFGAGSENLKIINCTFSRNAAAIYGGAIAIDTAGPTLANTILWGNTAFLSNEDIQIIRFGSVSVTFNHCIVQGWTGSLGGTGNNGLNPLFVDDDGADNVVGTVDDNLRVGVASPAIDTGDTSALPPDTADLNANGNVAEATPLDLDNHPRVLNTAVDRGVYESIPVIPCDFDHDGDVDMDDFTHFKTCATRAGITQSNGSCADTKLDADTDVDMSDFGIFQHCYSGAGKPGRTNCAN